jgi:hypothetical protein
VPPTGAHRYHRMPNGQRSMWPLLIAAFGRLVTRSATDIPIDVGGGLISLATAGQFSDNLRRVVISPGDSARPAVRSRRSALISGMPNSAAVAAQLAS